MNPTEYCRAKTGGNASSLYYATMFLSAQQRGAVLAVYALDRELDAIKEQCREPAVAEARLQWWRREIDAVYRGTAAHPVGRALTGPVADFRLAREYFLEMLDAAQTAALQPRLDSARGLDLYYYRRGAVPALLSAMIAGFDDRRVLKQVHALGVAHAMFELLQQLGRNAREGRVYLDAEDMNRHAVTQADILNCTDSGAVHALIIAGAEEILERLRRAAGALAQYDRRGQLTVRVLAAINEAVLEEMLADPGQVLKGHVDLTPLRKLWIAWRTGKRQGGRRAPGRFA
jgi:phytoene synthase